jgi:hypothetical protein
MVGCSTRSSSIRWAWWRSYEFANLRIQKNGWYRYDMLWRLDEYYNPAQTISFGEHFRNTSRRMLDNGLVLFPQAKIQFRFGYSRNKKDSHSLSNMQLLNSRGNIFTPFMNVRRLYNEFRIGNDIELWGFRFSWLHAWDNFGEGRHSQPRRGATVSSRYDLALPVSTAWIQPTETRRFGEATCMANGNSGPLTRASPTSAPSALFAPLMRMRWVRNRSAMNLQTVVFRQRQSPLPLAISCSASS